MYHIHHVFDDILNSSQCCIELINGPQNLLVFADGEENVGNDTCEFCRLFFNDNANKSCFKVLIL